MSKNLKIFSLLLGICLFLYGGYLLFERYTTLSPEAPIQVAAQSDKSPVSIEIPKLSLTLPIFESNITAGKWETTSRGVSYFLSTPRPGEMGNIVMYGHNWPNILGNLKRIKPGDEIKLKARDGEEFTYIVHFVSVVTPGETHIYQNTNDHRLTLYTCFGFLDSKRLVVTAIQAS